MTKMKNRINIWLCVILSIILLSVDMSGQKPVKRRGRGAQRTEHTQTRHNTNQRNNTNNRSRQSNNFENSYSEDLKKGQELFNREQFADAKAHFEGMLQKYPSNKNDISIWIKTCDTIIAQNKEDQRRRDEQIRLEEERRAYNEHMDEGEQLIAKGHYEEAKNHFISMMSMFPNYSVEINEKIQFCEKEIIRLEEIRKEEILLAFEDALSNGDVAYQNGNYEEALNIFENMLLIYPNYSSAINERIELCNDGLDKLEKIRTEEKDAYNDNLLQADVYVEIGMYAEAMSLYSELLIQYPNFADITRERIELCNERKTESDKLISFNNDMAEGEGMLNKRMYGSAKSHFESMLILYPEYAPIIKEKLEVCFNSILEFEVNGVRFNMLVVKGGNFLYRNISKSEDAPLNPEVEVSVDDFFIGETEVTQELYEAVMGTNPSRYKGMKLPVTNISWYECDEFIEKLNQITGMNFRLPKDVEWIYAAQGGNISQGYKYSGSNRIDDVAWYDMNTSNYMASHVKRKQPNELGLYDMSGNVSEWCINNFSGNRGILRGGNWNTYNAFCAVSDRRNYVIMDLADKNYASGLRLLLSVNSIKIMKNEK